MQFAIENGLMSEEDAARMKEMGNMTGPGGCKGEECRNFCEDPAHREECMAFANERGMGDGRGPGGPEGQGPDHAIGQERAFERRGFEVPPGLMEECKENPEACRERFQQQGFPGGDSENSMNMSEEERQQFMQQGGRGMDFRPPQGEGKPYQPEGMMPPEAFRHPPDGEMGGEFQQQYQDQYKAEYDRQYQEQFQQQSRQFMPPPGEFRPPEGSGGFPPPGEFHPQEGGSFQPPPDGGMMQPPPDGGMMSPPPDGGGSAPPPSDAPHASGAAKFVASVFYLLMGFIPF